MKTRVVANVSQQNLGAVMFECVNKTATICTDENAAYKKPGKEFAAHHSVNHSKYEWTAKKADGVTASTNHCESFFSLFKRGVYGTWHNISREHMQKYSNEFEFRRNTNKLTDGARMVVGIPMVVGKRLFYRQPKLAA